MSVARKQPHHLSAIEIESMARMVMSMVDQSQSTEERNQQRRSAIASMLKSSGAAALAGDDAVIAAFDALFKRALIDGSALGVAASMNILTKMGAISATLPSPPNPSTLN